MRVLYVLQVMEPKQKPVPVERVPEIKPTEKVPVERVPEKKPTEKVPITKPKKEMEEEKKVPTSEIEVMPQRKGTGILSVLCICVFKILKSYFT